MMRALLFGAGLSLTALPPVAALADIVPPPDEVGPVETAPPGELDGSWRVITADSARMPIVTLDIAHAAGEAHAAGVFTALPGLCPPVAMDADCDWDGITGEVTDITLTDAGVVISFNPTANADDEQNLRLTAQADGSWAGTLDGEPTRAVTMRRPGPGN